MNTTPTPARTPRQRRRSARLQAQDRQRAASAIRLMFQEAAEERQPNARHPWSADLLRYRLSDEAPAAVRDVTIRLELEYSTTTPYRATIVLVAQRDGQEAEVLRASDIGASAEVPQIERWPEDLAIGALVPKILFLALGDYPGAGVLPEGEA